ncbi:MAG: sigma-70 family RNA polymerase sigma factor [Gemmatimonadaceae bacterium]
MDRTNSARDRAPQVYLSGAKDMHLVLRWDVVPTRHSKPYPAAEFGLYVHARMSIFPDTRYSVIADLANHDATVRNRATELVARAYRGAVIAVLRQRWSLNEEDAEDLAHDFFLHALDREWLLRYDAEKGRFRTFLRACLTAFASTTHESATRLKRGGGAAHLSLDDAAPMLANDPQIDALFEREWVRGVMQLALTALREECDDASRETTWEIFVAHDIEGAELAQAPSYADLAERFAVPRTQVTNYLNWARRRLRAHVVERLRGLTASDEEFRDEARALIGAHNLTSATLGKREP